MENIKAFMLMNGGKTSFFLLSPMVLANGSQVEKEQKRLFCWKSERDILPLLPLGKELHHMVSNYCDIMYIFQFGKQKFPDFDLTRN